MTLVTKFLLIAVTAVANPNFIHIKIITLDFRNKQPNTEITTKKPKVLCHTQTSRGHFHSFNPKKENVQKKLAYKQA